MKQCLVSSAGSVDGQLDRRLIKQTLGLTSLERIIRMINFSPHIFQTNATTNN